MRSLPRNSSKPMSSTARAATRKRHAHRSRRVSPCGSLRGNAERRRQRVVTFDLHPVRLARELIVDLGRRFQMRQIRFQQIAMEFGVVALRFFADEALRLGRRDAKIDNQILDRQCRRLDIRAAQARREIPRACRAALARPDALGSRRYSGRREACGRLIGRFPSLNATPSGRPHTAVPRNADRLHRAVRIPHSKTARPIFRKNHRSEGSSLGEWESARSQSPRQHFQLRPFSGAVNSFEDDEFSARRHRVSTSLAHGG